ncbi:MAG: pantoate--beta-alanine ligase [Candidatus Omnitrophica bacterium]|nr:pantoate--beta-alanine ligase [Candidatus Omnitrophota bacterium]
MLATSNIKKTTNILKKVKLEKKKIGFVPTMGALHKGHISLVKKALSECDFVVVSIFVNPIQFSEGEDFNKYPRDLIKDKDLLRELGVDLVFVPDSAIMYSSGHSVYVDENYLSKRLCGLSRPGHFKGVCTVLAKLFNIIGPDTAYFGQKDYQQFLIIKRLVQDLNFNIDLRILPILRDKKGLALSSRNSFLNKEKYIQALCLYRSLQLAKKAFDRGQRISDRLIRIIKDEINKEQSAKIDYVEVVDAQDLKPLRKITSQALVALAVYIDRVRLIDNIILNVKKKKN